MSQTQLTLFNDLPIEISLHIHNCLLALEEEDRQPARAKYNRVIQQLNRESLGLGLRQFTDAGRYFSWRRIFICLKLTLEPYI